MTWDDAGSARLVDLGSPPRSGRRGRVHVQARPGAIGPDAGVGESLVEENERLRAGHVAAAAQQAPAGGCWGVARTVEANVERSRVVRRLGGARRQAQGEAARCSPGS